MFALRLENPIFKDEFLLLELVVQLDVSLPVGLLSDEHVQRCLLLVFNQRFQIAHELLHHVFELLGVVDLCLDRDGTLVFERLEGLSDLGVFDGEVLNGLVQLALLQFFLLLLHVLRRPLVYLFQLFHFFLGLQGFLLLYFVHPFFRFGLLFALGSFLFFLRVDAQVAEAAFELVVERLLFCVDFGLYGFLESYWHVFFGLFGGGFLRASC